MQGKDTERFFSVFELVRTSPGQQGYSRSLFINRGGTVVEELKFGINNSHSCKSVLNTTITVEYVSSAHGQGTLGCSRRGGRGQMACTCSIHPPS